MSHLQYNCGMRRMASFKSSLVTTLLMSRELIINKLLQARSSPTHQFKPQVSNVREVVQLHATPTPDSAGARWGVRRKHPAGSDELVPSLGRDEYRECDLN